MKKYLLLILLYGCTEQPQEWNRGGSYNDGYFIRGGKLSVMRRDTLEGHVYLWIYREQFGSPTTVHDPNCR